MGFRTEVAHGETLSQMIGNRTEGPEAMTSRRKSGWMEYGVLGGVCALVIGVYVSAAHSGVTESSSLNAADTYYNLLVEGFRAGQLSLKKEVPAGLAQLADPYDPNANVPYRSVSYNMLDLSYYKGHLYLYWGITPALVLFWPYLGLTGHYLFHRQAVAIFCALGFLVSVGLLHALWWRYFAEVKLGAVAACVVALGLATGVPVLLTRCDVYEVSVSCGYLLTMVVLGAIWCALHQAERRWRWLAVASAAYGLALGARPNLLFGAVILLAPVIQGWRERRSLGALLAAAMGPITVIGLGLMLYNALRFDSPFEFGVRYMLAPERMDAGPHFSLRYLWCNFRVYFLEPVRWSSQFPFVREIVLPPLPSGHNGNVEQSFGVLTNIPLVWLAPLGAGLAWRGRSAEARFILHLFVAAVVLVLVICALTLCLFFAVCMRYEVEFLPALMLLAVVGILGLERALAGRPLWRRAARWGWGVLLGFSVAFNLLAGVENRAEAQDYMGSALFQAGKIREAISHYEQALRMNPDLARAHNNLGVALDHAGKPEDAAGHFEQALRLKPDYADAHNNLGAALDHLGRLEEAIAHFEQALRIKPDFAKAHYNLGDPLLRLGRVQEAIGHFEQALQLNPGLAEAHNSLGVALQQVGKPTEAIRHFEQALQIKSDYAEAHYNLGVVLEQAGRSQEAIRHYQQALRLKPDFAGAKNALARLTFVQ